MGEHVVVAMVGMEWASTRRPHDGDGMGERVVVAMVRWNGQARGVPMMEMEWASA